ncbi:MAG: hypothetical protein ACRD0F_01620 [Acidimicrobiales bacterium]
MLLGLFGGVDLIMFKVIDSDNVLVTVLPVAGLVLGAVLGLVAPLGRRRGA